MAETRARLEKAREKKNDVKNPEDSPKSLQDQINGQKKDIEELRDKSKDMYKQQKEPEERQAENVKAIE